MAEAKRKAVGDVNLRPLFAHSAFYSTRSTAAPPLLPSCNPDEHYPGHRAKTESQ